MITLFEKYNPISKPDYDLIIIKIVNESQSKMIQEMCFKVGIYWCDGQKEYYKNPYDEFHFNIDLRKGEIWINNTKDLSNWIGKNYNIDPTIYTFDDFVKIARILKYGVDTPSYKPKKLIRESVERKKYPYDEITIKVNNQYEINELHEKLQKVYKLYSRNPIEAELFPNYLFITNVNTYVKDDGIYYCYLSDDDTSDEALQDLAFYNPRIDKNILTLKDWHIIKSILLYGERIIKPSYEPRKIDRTLERSSLVESIENKWYPYRFKTKQEFEKEFGHNFHNRVWWNSGGEMDYLFGQVYPFNIKSLEDELPSYNGRDINYIWSISPLMLTKNNPIIPSYKPKKIDRTLEQSSLIESINFENYLVLTNNREDSLKFEDFLHKNGLKWGRIGQEGREYLLKDSSSIKQILFVKIDKLNKLFTGYDFELLSDNWLEENYPNAIILKYDKDMNKINNLISITPTYKPRKIDRTLESTKYNYDNIVFEVLNNEQNEKLQKDLFIKDYRWSSGRNIVPFPNYPVYLFVDSYDNSISYFTTSTGYPYNDINTYIEYSINNYKRNVCRKVFRYDEGIHIDSIFKTGMVGPSYKPKKIDRTLESIKNEWYPYRFKTENEFKNEFGENWRQIIRMMWLSPNMDYLFGKNYPYNINEKDFNDDNFNSFGGWTISNHMLIKNKPNVPSYEPKKIDRTLEHINENITDYKYDTIVFKANSHDENDIMQKKLFKLGFTWFRSSQRVYEFNDSNFPVFIYCDIPTLQLSFTLSSNTYDEESALKFINDCNINNNENILPKIFNYKDVIYFNIISKTGSISPSYKPRKIDRTLENVNQLKYFNPIKNEPSEYPYRFKIKEEFEKEFGHNWRNIVLISWMTPDMDFLYGKNYKYLTDKNIEDFDSINDTKPLYHSWMISTDMLIKNKSNAPTYNPRKIKRTLEQSSLVETLNFEDYLKKLEDNYGDDEIAKQTLEQYKSDIENIQKEGGELYRIVFLKDKSELEDNKLGEHWTLYKDDISRYFHNIRVDNDEVFPYLITGKFSPDSIDEESSWETFIQLPDEQEINIKKEPISYIIEPYFYDYTWKILFIQQQILDYYGFERDEWEDFINNQEMGDCQFISKLVVDIAKENNIDGVSNIFGHIELDEPYYNAEEDEDTDIFTHHWNIIDGEIVEFSKGTLKNFIDWDNLYNTLTYFEENKYKEL